MGNNFIHSEITEKIIKAYFKVYNSLGYGFLEKVYENALVIEIRKEGLVCEQQKQIDVLYDNKIVGLYYTDIIVEDRVIIELKASEILIVEHETQLVNYLKATNIEVGLLLNFGKEAEIRRKVLNNEFKTHKTNILTPVNK